MKVVMVPQADDGSAHYRMRQPAAALQAKGYDVQVCHYADPELPYIAATASVLMFNRPSTPDVVKLIDQAHEHGITVVVDVDDNFDSIDRDHAVKKRASVISESIHLACAAADLVTVTTPKLDQIYGYGHGIVIPNYVDETWLDVEPQYRDDGAPIIGWTGTISSHPHDLDVIGNGLRRAMQDAPGRLLTLGSKKGPMKFAATKAVSLGYAKWEDYPAAYASFDVAIVPLADTAFNEAKSWLKGLEAAALGVPFVASPTVEYQRLMSCGAGWTAKDPADWRRKIGYLLKDEQARAELAFSGKEAARQLTIQGNCERYMEAWTDARLRHLATVS